MFLGYIWGADSENALNFFNLALVFEISVILCSGICETIENEHIFTMFKIIKILISGHS